MPKWGGEDNFQFGVVKQNVGKRRHFLLRLKTFRLKCLLLLKSSLPRYGHSLEVTRRERERPPAKTFFRGIERLDALLECYSQPSRSLPIEVGLKTLLIVAISPQKLFPIFTVKKGGIIAFFPSKISLRQ